MATLSREIDNASPLLRLQYITGTVDVWTGEQNHLGLGNSSDVSLDTTQLFNATIGSTYYDGLIATFLFNGTGVSAYGSKGPYDGGYNVWLDGNKVLEGNASASTYEYQQLLYQDTDIDFGYHNLTFENNPYSYTQNVLEIDYIAWNTAFGDDSAHIVETTADSHDSTYWRYDGGTWNSNPDISALDIGDAYSTDVNDAYATIMFEGDAIEVYGATSQHMGAFTPILDGQNLGVYQPFRTQLQMLNVLFYADNLGSGTHNLTLISTPSSWVDGGTGTLLIGYASIFTAATNDETVATAGPLQPVYTSTSSPSSSSDGLPGISASPQNSDTEDEDFVHSSSKLAGVLVGSLVGFLSLVGAIIYVWWRLKRRRRAKDLESRPFMTRDRDSFISEPDTPGLSDPGSPYSTCMSRTLITDYPSVTCMTTDTVSGVYAYELPPDRKGQRPVYFSRHAINASAVNGGSSISDFRRNNPPPRYGRFSWSRRPARNLPTIPIPNISEAGPSTGHLPEMRNSRPMLRSLHQGQRR